MAIYVSHAVAVIPAVDMGAGGSALKKNNPLSLQTEAIKRIADANPNGISRVFVWLFTIDCSHPQCSVVIRDCLALLTSIHCM